MIALREGNYETARELLWAGASPSRVLSQEPPPAAGEDAFAARRRGVPLCAAVGAYRDLSGWRRRFEVRRGPSSLSAADDGSDGHAPVFVNGALALLLGSGAEGEAEALEVAASVTRGHIGCAASILAYGACCAHI